VTKLVSVIGYKNAGKTTLVAALSHEFKRQKKRVATIKHSSHPVDVDRQDTDSWRHFHEGNADSVLVASPELRVTFERGRMYDPSPSPAATSTWTSLVGGYKRASIPRSKCSAPPSPPRSPAGSAATGSRSSPTITKPCAAPVSRTRCGSVLPPVWSTPAVA
jgi:molybdopterin-guanine dinucleotide biosynthesis protein MobB